MKAHEGELVKEISKLQGMVSELKAGFSRALLELNQIQECDGHLQAELEDTRRGCNKRALHLEALVQSLREELGEVRCQLQLLCSGRHQAEHDRKPLQTGESKAGAPAPRDSEDAVGCVGGATPPSPPRGGSLLLHCYLQGLKAGQRQGIGADGQVMSRGGGPQQGCSLEGKRQCLALMLLHSEWQYVSSLEQLHAKYKTQPAPPGNPEPHKAFLRYVEQMLQHHEVFRNGLEDYMSADQWNCHIGDALVKLTGPNESVFSDAYLGYMSSLAPILSTEFSRAQTDQTQEEGERLKLISLLLAPVSRIHNYLGILQSLLDWTGSGHPDWHSLQESERVLQNLLSSCLVTLEGEGQWEEQTTPAAANPSGSRSCEAESPDRVPSAFTKYRANARMPQGMLNSWHQGGECHPPVPQPIPPSAGILRTDAQPGRLPLCISSCPSVPNGCWPPLGTAAWEAKPGRCQTLPVRVLGNPHTRELSLFLNRTAPQAKSGAEVAAPPGQSSCGRVLERGLAFDGRPNGPQLYHPKHCLHDCDTDCDQDDLGDASVFDYSSVTSCSPDDTLEMRHQGGGALSHEEEDEEEDSEVPVLLKPTYTHSTLPPGGAVDREGAVCMRWQLPRASSLVPGESPPEMGQGSRTRRVHISTNPPQRLPSSSFRPIWDTPYQQGDGMPPKGNTLPLRKTPHPQKHERVGTRAMQTGSLFRARCQGSPVGAQRTNGIWNESEDSEGPCSTV